MNETRYYTSYMKCYLGILIGGDKVELVAGDGGGWLSNKLFYVSDVHRIESFVKPQRSKDQQKLGDFQDPSQDYLF